MNELIRQIQRLGSGVIAIDGPCASGKSTLAEKLGRRFHANVFHMDDFFLRPEQQTPGRRREPGGNADRERFLEEVLLPLSQGRDVAFRPYSCATQKVGAPVFLPYTKLSIVEGVYCQHPLLRGHYDLKVFLRVNREVQLARLLARNGETYYKRFVEEFIPNELTYFQAFHIEETADVVIGPL